MTQEFRYQVNETVASLDEMMTKDGVINARQKFLNFLEQTDIPQTALRKGSKIPSFTLPNHLGELTNIEDLYKNKPLVIAFYRGQWCPFCSLQLRALQQSLAQIVDAPADMVAISPQIAEFTLSTKSKFNLGFEVLSDFGSVVGKKFGIVYRVPSYIYTVFQKYGADLELFNGEPPEVVTLPASAVYIVDQEGTIIFDSVSVFDYEKTDPKDVVNFLKQYTSNQ